MAELTQEQLAALEAEAEAEERLGFTASHSAVLTAAHQAPVVEAAFTPRPSTPSQKDWRAMLEVHKREKARRAAELEADEIDWKYEEQKVELEEAEAGAGAAVAARDASGRVYHPAEVARVRSRASEIHGHLIERGFSSSDPTEYE